ncbi:MAG: hypothetical protein QNI85_15210, partial [Desulfobacterales bacterium]|nr:hypothetical protein [Desulfobacterales bacterium]
MTLFDRPFVVQHAGDRHVLWVTVPARLEAVVQRVSKRVKHDDVFLVDQPNPFAPRPVKDVGIP